MKKLILTAALLSMSLIARADLNFEIQNYVGYTIVAVKTITGWYDPDGDHKSGNAFQGCQYGRVIIFDHTQSLTCSEYGYQYAFSPKAVVLSNGGSFVMFVEGQHYAMRR